MSDLGLKHRFKGKIPFNGILTEIYRHLKIKGIIKMFFFFFPPKTLRNFETSGLGLGVEFPDAIKKTDWFTFSFMEDEEIAHFCLHLIGQH